MSYILDALRKAEEERQRQAGLDSRDVRKILPSPRQRRKIWPYLIFLVFSVNILIVVWWIGPWKSETSVSLQEGPIKQPLVTQSQNNKQIEFMSSSTDNETPASKSSKKDRAASPPDSSPEEISITETERSAGNIQAKTEPQRENDAGSGVISPPKDTLSGRKPGQIPAPSAADRIYALNELPSSVLQDLPDLSISLLYYTEDPASRLVSIKDRTLREGSELIPGLKLLGIASDSAIFGYRNYLFRVAVNRR